MQSSLNHQIFSLCSKLNIKFPVYFHTFIDIYSIIEKLFPFKKGCTNLCEILSLFKLKPNQNDSNPFIFEYNSLARIVNALIIKEGFAFTPHLANQVFKLEEKIFQKENKFNNFQPELKWSKIEEEEIIVENLPKYMAKDEIIDLFRELSIKGGKFKKEDITLLNENERKICELKVYGKENIKSALLFNGYF